MNYAEAIEFVKDQADSIGIGFHPDTRYADYIDKRTGAAIYEVDEAARLQSKLDQAFEVLGVEIYDVAAAEIKRVWDESAD